jgi:hypothetical protein
VAVEQDAVQLAEGTPPLENLRPGQGQDGIQSAPEIQGLVDVGVDAQADEGAAQGITGIDGVGELDEGQVVGSMTIRFWRGRSSNGPRCPG